MGTIDYSKNFNMPHCFSREESSGLMNEALLQMKHNLGAISHSAVCTYFHYASVPFYLHLSLYEVFE